MPDSPVDAHARPVVCRTATTVSLHFAWEETQSCMDLRHPDALHLEYTRTMMGFLLFIPAPRNIVMVGLGGGSLAKFCHRHLPRSRIRVVEINPHVIALRDEFQVPPDSSRFSVVQGDGAAYVQAMSRPCDVLLTDGYDHKGLPASLSSARYYADCRELLGPDGMLVVNLHCSQARWQQQIARIRRSFDGGLLTVADDDGSNRVVFASPGHLAPQPTARPLRRPRGLDDDAWAQLRAPLARVLAAAHEAAP
jgi:spermidine synthase